MSSFFIKRKLSLKELLCPKTLPVYKTFVSLSVTLCVGCQIHPLPPGTLQVQVLVLLGATSKQWHGLAKSRWKPPEQFFLCQVATRYNAFPDSVYYPGCVHYKLITMDISVKIPVTVKLLYPNMVKLYLSHQILLIFESSQLIYNPGLFITTGNGPGLQGI